MAQRPFTIDDREVRARLNHAIRNAPDEFARAQYQETQVELKECQRRCPVRYGTLKGTLHVEGPEHKVRGISTAIVAGGPAAMYAVYVHEDITAFHPHGEAKFIERPLNESAPYMAARIARRIDFNRILR